MAGGATGAAHGPAELSCTSETLCAAITTEPQAHHLVHRHLYQQRHEDTSCQGAAGAEVWGLFCDTLEPAQTLDWSRG